MGWIIVFIALIIVFRIVTFAKMLLVVSSPVKIDWKKHKVVVFESDDWGMCDWSPNLSVYKKLNDEVFVYEGTNRQGIPISKEWGKSTLESPADMERLFQILEKHKGGDGRPAIFQANYIMAAPDYVAIKSNGFKRFEKKIIPDVPSLWERGDFVEKAKEGIQRGVWRPEFHGLLHFESNAWLKLLRKKDPKALLAFENQCHISGHGFNGKQYGKTVRFSQHKSNFSVGVTEFINKFGYRPSSSVAPCYQWGLRIEKILSDRGIKAVQAKNLQENSGNILKKIMGKLLRLIGVKSSNRFWEIEMGDYNCFLDVVFLTRNVNFEPRGNSDLNAKKCANNSLFSIEDAWNNNEPAIVNSHRINYAYLDSYYVQNNLKQLECLLKAVLSKYPETVFLVDSELAQLYKNGISILITNNDIICRNYGGGIQTFKISIPDNAIVKQVANLSNGKKIQYHVRSKEIYFKVEEGNFKVEVEKMELNENVKLDDVLNGQTKK